MLGQKVRWVLEIVPVEIDLVVEGGDEIER